LHWDKPDLYAADSAKIYAYSKGVGTLFSEDAQSIAILVKIEPNLSKQETDTVYFEMKEVMNRFAFDEMHVAGKVIGQAYYIEQIQFEFALFFSIAILLVVFILSLVYRSIWGVIVPLLVVMLSAIWLLGLMSSTCSADISKRFETGRQSLRPSWLLTNRWEWQPFLPHLQLPWDS